MTVRPQVSLGCSSLLNLLCSRSVLVLQFGQKKMHRRKTKDAPNCGCICFLTKRSKKSLFFFLFCCVQGFYENRQRSNLLFSLRESKGALIFSLPIRDWIIIVKLLWVTVCAVQCPDLHLNETKWLYIQKWYTVMMMVIKANSCFILDRLLLGIAVILGLCRYKWWVISLLCQGYYLHISTSRFINMPPKRLNVVSHQPSSSLASPVRCVGECNLKTLPWVFIQMQHTFELNFKTLEWICHQYKLVCQEKQMLALIFP